MNPPIQIETAQVTAGGATLKQLWDAGPARAAIRDSRWDFVVLQEQSTLGATFVEGRAVINDPERIFWPYVRLFDREIRESGARTALLQTWGERGGTRNFDGLAHAYFTIGKVLGAVVIPAGLAWQRALARRADLPLYHPDGSHPAPSGSYLAALATVATLFDSPSGSPPVTIRGHPTGFDGKPVDSLGTLAAVDSGTVALFGRVIADVRQELARNGGYLAVARPPMPAPPTLPPGRPIPEGGLSGAWDGTLRLFGPDGHRFRLELRPGARGTYQGNVSLDFDTTIREAKPAFRVEGDVFDFSMVSPVDRSIRVQFRGVLTGGDRIAGIALMASTERSWNFTGYWTASRRRTGE